ncbi:MAG: winged helix-turn-helix domain-containing protein [Undibacterium sp.]|nr:winged helix-turn-helix domain-containing protein [Undibacterium sp.]
MRHVFILFKEWLVLLTFRDVEIDTSLFTLRVGKQVSHVEPQVFDLIVYLAQHRDRIVSQQELLDTLWAGKVVTESSLRSCIKAARQALGDSGDAQNCIATIRHRGYRFVAAPQTLEVAEPKMAAMMTPAAGLAETVTAGPRRASIAVMPFADLSALTETRAGIADALVHDVIFQLAQMRSLFVIAQGSVFAPNVRRMEAHDAGRLLQVDYVVSGAMRLVDGRLSLTVELAETCTRRLVWVEDFCEALDDALLVLNQIGSKIVASVASEVEMTERNRAILRPPDSLDAWEAYHRGLWHMYRFNQEDNLQAQHFFDMAVRLDPTFSRAYTGLSFTHFQNAFQGWAPREIQINLAFKTASQSLEVDERNPAAHLAMGRALWLRGDHTQSVSELGQTIDLSPSFALGHYTLAFVHSQTGDPHTAILASDHSRLLSPFDPLLFGMLGARAIAHVRLGQFSEAADWAVKAAARPNAHTHILAVAAYSLALAGSLKEARAFATAIRKIQPQYNVDNFIQAFRFDAQGATLFRQGARLIDMT